MENRHRVMGQISKSILGSALSVDGITHPIYPTSTLDINERLKDVFVSNWIDYSSMWANDWVDVIIYRNTKAKIAKFINSPTLERVEFPDTIKMVLLNGENVNRVVMAEGVEFFFARKCKNLKEIYLPRSIKKAVLPSTCTVINFEEVSANVNMEVVYDAKYLIEIDEIRNIMAQILRDNVDINV